MTELFSASSLEIPRDEALRYTYCVPSAAGDGLLALYKECLPLFNAQVCYRACRLRTPVAVQGDTVQLGFCTIVSRRLSQRLERCDEAYVFAATTGIGVDRLINREKQLSPSRGLMMEGIGSAAAEAWCDCLCAQWAAECEARGEALLQRYSPGYGDLPLSVQRPLLDALDAYRNIGVSLSESLIMTPRKSVTAIIGIRKSR